MAPRTLVAMIGLAMTLVHAQAPAILGAEPTSYPNRAIRIIVPFPPGGPADMIARLVAQRMSEDWGQPVLVENRAGGNTAIGAQVAARSAPDGYTLLAAMDTTMVMNPLVTPNLPYDPLRDLAPITLLIRTVALVVVRSDGPKTIKELIAKAKANPGKLTIGSAGLGTVTHLANELFRREAKVDFTHVPYKSTANSINDLLGGHIDAIFGDVALVTPQAEAGKLVALAVTGESRSPLMPDLITTAEAGFPAVQTEVWYGALVSVKTPAPIVARLKAATRAVQTDPVTQKMLRQHGVVLGEPGSEAFAKFIRQEIERWTPIVTTVKMN